MRHTADPARYGRRGVGAWALVCMLLLALVPVPATAQSRQAQAQTTRADKAKTLTPPKRGKVEAALIWVENQRLFEARDGFFPRVGMGIEGGGFALGPGYRKTRLFGGLLDVTASAAMSIRQYRGADAAVAAPRLWQGRGFFEIAARYRDAPVETFFGFGPGSSQGARVTFAWRETAVNGTFGIRPAGWFTVGARLERLAATTEIDGPPPDGSRTAMAGAVPAGGAATELLVSEVFVGIDYRKPRANARTGGSYRLSFRRHQDRHHQHTFDRLDADLRQYVSPFYGQRTLALRAFASLSDPRAGQEVPLYLQPTLGGGSSLRGFPHHRFRDRNVLLLQVEYRWDVWPFLQAALFYDAGTVASRPESLRLAALEHDYGLGLRFGSDRAMFLSTDVAFGSGEGTRILVRFDHAF